MVLYNNSRRLRPEELLQPPKILVEYRTQIKRHNKTVANQALHRNPMTPKQLDAYRQRIKEKLRANGFPVDAWEEAARQRHLENPRPRPATRIIPTYTQGRRMVRPGYEEYRPHPRHGKLIPRCLARSAFWGRQCGNFAVKGQYVCTRHGGKVTQARRDATRLRSEQGKGESRAERKARSEASRLRRAVEKKVREFGI